MLNYRFIAAIVGLVLAFTPVVIAAPADAPPAKSAEQARIDQAIEAYAGKLKADDEKALDQAVANRATALLRDPNSLVLGNPDGDVAIVEFFDYTCPYCKAVDPRLQELLRTDKGVKLIIKEFPILRPESLVAAKVAFASARQGRYESFHRAVLAFRGLLTEPAIFEIAASVGLDVERLRKDMDAPEIADAIIANFNLARALRVTTTPTFIIGTHFVTESSATLDFAKAVAAARAK